MTAGMRLSFFSLRKLPLSFRQSGSAFFQLSLLLQLLLFFLSRLFLCLFQSLFILLKHIPNGIGRSVDDGSKQDQKPQVPGMKENDGINDRQCDRSYPCNDDLHPTPEIADGKKYRILDCLLHRCMITSDQRIQIGIDQRYKKKLQVEYDGIEDGDCSLLRIYKDPLSHQYGGSHYKTKKGYGRLFKTSFKLVDKSPKDCLLLILLKANTHGIGCSRRCTDRNDRKTEDHKTDIDAEDITECIQRLFQFPFPLSSMAALIL